MGYQTAQPTAGGLWELVRRQHGVVSRAQLLELGFGPQAIKHRVAKGRLHPVWRGVYALGRPQISRSGQWMGAVLSCGPEAVLSHASAAALWEIRADRGDEVEVSVPAPKAPRRPGIVVHRRATLGGIEVTVHLGIPVTTPVHTLVDLAAVLTPGQIEAAVNEADKRDLIDPDTLRTALDGQPKCPGLATLRELLDRRTFALTDSELERRFLRIVRRAGLPLPRTGCVVNGFKVDFHWPEFGVVVETDGLRYHRTPAQQSRDRVRDQAHAVAGLTPLRFTHAQVRFDPDHVRRTLLALVAPRPPS